MSLIKQILDYEHKIFTDYENKRNLMISELKKIDSLDSMKSADNDVLLNMVFDIKNIIDPIKNSITAIDFFIENKNKNFISAESVQDSEKLKSMMQIIVFFTSYMSLSKEANPDVNSLD